jgi:hypothetical protein
MCATLKSSYSPTLYSPSNRLKTVLLCLSLQDFVRTYFFLKKKEKSSHPNSWMVSDLSVPLASKPVPRENRGTKMGNKL